MARVSDEQPDRQPDRRGVPHRRPERRAQPRAVPDGRQVEKVGDVDAKALLKQADGAIRAKDQAAASAAVTATAS